MLRLYGTSPERVVVERPPKVALGDLASPVAFDLAKALKKAPRAIAAEIAAAVALPAGVAAVRVEGGGYVNASLDRAAFAAGLAEARAGAGGPRAARPSSSTRTSTRTRRRTSATSATPCWATCSCGRCASWGDEVEVQNYLDDTGVQVADVVAGLAPRRRRRRRRPRRRRRSPRRRPGRGRTNPKGFAYLCWDLYAEVGRTYEARPETKAWRAEVLHAIEAGDNETARIAAAVAEAVSSAHLATMGRIGIAYDLLPRESDILKKNFWARAFEMLKGSGAVILETEGKHAGCWVLRLAESEEFAGLEEPDKILVRSNGTVTYTAKDIAYQLWKFGLLGIDFDYERFTPGWDSGAVLREEVPASVLGHPVWRTSHGAGEPGAPAFGRAASASSTSSTSASPIRRRS